MLPISNSSPPTESTHTQIDTIPLNNDSKCNKFNNRDEAIDHIKGLTYNQFNTIRYSDNKDEIQLNSLELQNGEKLYYIAADIPSKTFFYIENKTDPWNFNDLKIGGYQDKHVFFIFDAKFSSDTVSVNTDQMTKELEGPKKELNEELNDIYYLHFNEVI